jgi:histidyl-tRNA synthetase
VALYGFTEIATPIIEHTELFKRSLGLQTDVVHKEMFLIAGSPEQEDADSICLRPEATASIVRAFVENQIQQTPWKVFTYGPMFRHERPQKGRYRQFNQISFEIIGSAAVAQDVHLITMLDRFFSETFSSTNYALHINYLGCAQDRVAYSATLKKFLDAHAGNLCSLCLERKEKNILRVFDCKNPNCQQVYTQAPRISDALCTTCIQEWQQLQEQLSLLSVSYHHKPTLVRGLDYYSKTVFEFISANLGAQQAFCAGGRYDQLVTDIGGKQDQPSIGAALGIERLMLLLEPYDNSRLMPAQLPLHVIIPLSGQQHTLALLLADELLAQNLATEILLEGDSLKSMMRKANKLGARYCLLLGEDEQAKREVTVKNMVTGQEERMAQTALVGYLKK